MAKNQGNTSRRLYFDVQLPGTRHSQTFLCTQFTAGTPGDRYGCLLRALEAATGSTTPQVKRSLAVGAWFQATGLAAGSVTTPSDFAVAFIYPVANGNYATDQTKMAYLTVGNMPVLDNVGNEAIYSITSGLTRHFAVQVSKARETAGITAHGVLYVQRPHSLEV